MRLEEQVCSLELARKLKELGVKQDSLWWYRYRYKSVELRQLDYTPVDNDICNCASAFTVLELGISARAYDKMNKISRTIADMEASDMIETHHISEAIGYRCLDRNLWC